MLLSLLLGWGNKIKVTESTSREWAGGLQESGIGTDYVLTARVSASSADLQIEDLWVGDIHMKVRVFAGTDNARFNVFEKGSNVTVKAGFNLRPGADQQEQLFGADHASKPINFRGEGLLAGKYKGKPFYIVIKEFKKLEKIIYPQ